MAAALRVLAIVLLAAAILWSWPGRDGTTDPVLPAAPTHDVAPPAPRVTVLRERRARPTRNTDELWPAEPDRPRRRTGTERQHYQRLSALEEADPSQFVEHANGIFDRPASTAERAATLRVWYDRGIEPRFELFDRALRRGPANPAADAPVRDYALRTVCNLARRDPAARSALAGFLDDCARGRCTTAPRVRAEALYAILRFGGDQDLRDRLDYLYAETDPGVLARGATALTASDAQEAGLILDRLEVRHPSAAGREAVQRARRAAAERR